MTEDFFEPPAHVETLDGVPPVFKAAYRQSDAGGYVLRQEYLDGVAKVRKEIADETAKAERDLAEAHAKLEAIKEQLRQRIAAKAIREALIRGGVKGGYLKAATALLLDELDIIAGDIDGEPVVMLDGGGSIEFAVGSWLTSEGQDFVEHVATVGAFASAIRSLH